MRNFKFSGVVFYLIITIGLTVCFWWCLMSVKKSQNQKHKIMAISDSMAYVRGINSYYSELLEFNMKSSNYRLNNNEIKSYNITEDTSKSSWVNFTSIFKKSKYNLVLRYTEIGCNDCSSLTLKKLNKLKELHPDLPIYAFVDFTNYDSYLQWRKVGEINFPVYYVKKGALAFDKDCPQYSYLFTISNDGTANNFFIPNRGIPRPLEYYFDNIYKQ